jgi:hypothetical protein
MVALVHRVVRRRPRGVVGPRPREAKAPLGIEPGIGPVRYPVGTHAVGELPQRAQYMRDFGSGIPGAHAGREQATTGVGCRPKLRSAGPISPRVRRREQDFGLAWFGVREFVHAARAHALGEGEQAGRRRAARRGLPRRRRRPNVGHARARRVVRARGREQGNGYQPNSQHAGTTKSGERVHASQPSGRAATAHPAMVGGRLPPWRDMPPVRRR